MINESPGFYFIDSNAQRIIKIDIAVFKVYEI
jgi:hypothetical protein